MRRILSFNNFPSSRYLCEAERDGEKAEETRNHAKNEEMKKTNVKDKNIFLLFFRVGERNNFKKIQKLFIQCAFEARKR